MRRNAAIATSPFEESLAYADPEVIALYQQDLERQKKKDERKALEPLPPLNPDDFWVEPGPNEISIPLAGGFETVVWEIDFVEKIQPLLQGRSIIPDPRPDNQQVYAFLWMTGPDGRTFKAYLQRVVMDVLYLPEFRIDHVSGNGLDNRRHSLARTNASGNSLNIRAGRGRSKLRNVFWHRQRKKWEVKVGIGGRRIPVGYFPESQRKQAGEAADNKMLEYITPTEIGRAHV